MLMRPLPIAAALLLASQSLACGGDSETHGFGGSGGGAGASEGSGGSGGLMFTGSGGSTGSAGSTGSHKVPPASAFVQADIGSYALGDPVGGAGIGDTGVMGGADGCKILAGVVRDFKGADEPGGHPDFEAFGGTAQTPGLVGTALSPGLKPTYTGICEAPTPTGNCPNGPQTSSAANFDEWYRFTKGTNKPYLVYFQFAANGPVSTFQSTHFFPLDGAGWGNSGMGTDGAQHNFHFTTELHTKFRYAGGETFTFSGDDDLWVFINGQLAMDLGGLHPAVTASISLDQSAAALGISAGKVYALELFHAERHTNESNFRVDTDLAFVDCGSVVPDPK